MISAIRAGVYGSSAASSLRQVGAKIFPFHPTVLPVLVRAIRKFGQNERSCLVSCLPPSQWDSSTTFSHKQSQLEPYRVHNLFEYVGKICCRP